MGLHCAVLQHSLHPVCAGGEGYQPGGATALPTSQNTRKARISPAPCLPVSVAGNDGGMEEWKEIYEERSLFII